MIYVGCVRYAVLLVDVNSKQIKAGQFVVAVSFVYVLCVIAALAW